MTSSFCACSQAYIFVKLHCFYRHSSHEQIIQSKVRNTNARNQFPKGKSNGWRGRTTSWDRAERMGEDIQLVHENWARQRRHGNVRRHLRHDRPQEDIQLHKSQSRRNEVRLRRMKDFRRQMSCFWRLNSHKTLDMLALMTYRWCTNLSQLLKETASFILNFWFLSLFFIKSSWSLFILLEL